MKKNFFSIRIFFNIKRMLIAFQRIQPDLLGVSVGGGTWKTIQWPPPEPDPQITVFICLRMNLTMTLTTGGIKITPVKVQIGQISLLFLFIHFCFSALELRPLVRPLVRPLAHQALSDPPTTDRSGQTQPVDGAGATKSLGPLSGCRFPCTIICKW